ncbi:hypothetical protein BMS3Abin16_00439 [archaeon BMS3Abin16]|nr:hypothetical protein BMS3Abin16_00439 [archaeon BMS3Abin16]GBE56610.1 hypothetical protein BMS3Bbin16_00819 [archaeon BMS3Bbin16]
MEKFVDDDERYLDWIEKNPSGFVVNSLRNPLTGYLMLHHADCWTISTPTRSNWTIHQYIKFCAPDKTELENWAQNEVRRDLKYCGICNK